MVFRGAGKRSGGAHISPGNDPARFANLPKSFQGWNLWARVARPKRGRLPPFRDGGCAAGRSGEGAAWRSRTTALWAYNGLPSPSRFARTTGFQARRGAAVDGLGRPSYAGRVTNPSYQRRRGCQRTARVESPRSGVRAASSPIAARRLTAYWEGRAAMGATGPFGERAAARTRHDRVDSHSRAPRSGRPPGPDRAKPHHPGRSASRPASTTSDPARGR